MFTALVAYVYPYKMILGPALVIMLAVNLTLYMKKPSMRGFVGFALIVFGFGETFGCLTMMFIEGFLIGLATLTIGIAATVGALQTQQPVHLSRQSRFSPKTAVSVAFIAMGAAGAMAGILARSFWLVILGLGAIAIGTALGLNLLSRFLKRRASRNTKLTLARAAYVALAVAVAGSVLMVSLRATNVVHEQRLEDWSGTIVNLTVQGIVSDVKLNYEVNTGYSYHISAAYVTLNVTKVLWATEFWENLTNAVEYYTGRTIIVSYDKPNPPSLNAEQLVEVCGYYSPWIEDWILSDKLIVTSTMAQGYLNLLQNYNSLT